MSKCHNLLLRKNNKYYLYNTSKPEKEGSNPLQFDTLQDYKLFMRKLNSQGIDCPLLYLQQTYDSQGTRTYRIHPSPEDPQPGLPTSNIETFEVKLYGSHNKGSIPGFDPMNQYIGVETPLDDMFHKDPSVKSDNPMDTNWGGAKFSRKSVKDGNHNPSKVYKTTSERLYN